MFSNASNVVSPALSRKTKWTAFARGQERFGFLYVVISAVVLGCTMSFSLVNGLGWTERVLMLIGGLFVAWGILFTCLEMHRLAQTPNERAEEVLPEEEPTCSAVTVQPPTGDPYPHHEDYPESAGFDQGQLTSRTPGSTPFLEDLVGRGEQNVAG